MTSVSDLVFAGAGALAAGGINAIAGGGTLVSFPILVALGVPSVHANATNTVALCPGYFGGAFAQRATVGQHKARLRRLLPFAGLGGLLGSILLVITSDSVFRNLVPFLILMACGLLGFQDGIKKRVFARRTSDASHTTTHEATIPLIISVFAASIYGGYFGAGLGIMLLAITGLLLDDELPKLNALKTVLSFVINVLAASFLVFSGKVEWNFVAVMAPASLVGGHFGGMLAGKMNPKVMRVIVITFGVAVAVKMLIW
ncbi:unannotated protein [freshwater metagenome]|uniref:Unannotated protein n=1 Tax=freshwater metagenome TaxID=449393 RepID=A0A6J6V5I0_9ZZZZ|nr:TSUP family transporter [Actinomycetota bacterium]MSX16028.1 TSUP family transporter [Actinomycetota bacterium]MSX77449.1 TSUP family transporter [Actinomycetota bacterium]MSZ71223.1 TSUP family transporter [Actinomycetota bacterium]MUH56393.1 TSUP family transporter [Actinomycetota bacterium]